ncbi:hypothetical protein PAPYR_4776 [Paratrimastix pyriformis]|uniref:F-box domain-containing protein n=1 Tax=Paratrimastix pyriformis TaxID=342808 RepID=A0ABQ8ULV2_9EUKA|nr:hypothetical protein PAPYR_4776 [Paratrimastix pyriformis]
MERLPDELLALIYQKLRSVKALAEGSLVSRQFRSALWTNGNTLWQQVYLEDFGARAAQEVESKLPRESVASISWRNKYQDQRELLRLVQCDRKKRVKAMIDQKRPPRLSKSLQDATYIVLNPLMVFVAIPLFLVFIILRAEGVLGWSLHAIFAPADYILISGLCLYGGSALMTQDRQGRFFWCLIGSLFPVGIATLHYAAARGDWILETGGSNPAPAGLNWMYVFTPAMALILGIFATLINLFCSVSAVDRAFAFLVGTPVCLLSLAFLVLLGYKLQWGGPGFSSAYVFIPLWLFAMGLFCVLVTLALVSYGNKRGFWGRLLFWGLSLPGSVTATLVLAAVRLDGGSVHTAFLAIPTLFWWVPLLYHTSRSAATRLRQPTLVQPLPELSSAELNAIENELIATYGEGIYYAHDDPYKDPYHQPLSAQLQATRELLEA